MEEELSNELPNWSEILDFIENLIRQLGMFIKNFVFNGQNCYTVCGIQNEYDIRLTDKEALMLIDYIVRFQMIDPGSEGLDKKKWKEIINLKLKTSKRTFSNILDGLISKGFLEESATHIKPGWRYFAILDIDNLVNEIKTDAKLNILTQNEEEERGIFD